MGAMHPFLLQQRGVVEFNDLHRATPDTALGTTKKATGFLFYLVLGIPRKGSAGFAVSPEE